MTVLKGSGVFGGIAFGKIRFYKRNTNEIVKYNLDDANLEIKRYEAAKNSAINQLQELYEKVIKEVGQANAMIFQIHQMMLEDLDYNESIINIIKNQKVNAEFAVNTTAEKFAQVFLSMDDNYMKERAMDVKDVSKRLLDVLIETTNSKEIVEEPTIIVADDLSPSETVQLDKSKILGFVMQKGSSSSHTSILAKTMNIPAIVGIGNSLNEEYDGKNAIVDGFTGKIYIEPDEQTYKMLKEKQNIKNEQEKSLQNLKGKENTTIDGQSINIYANIGDVADVVAVIQNDAGGIGLFRSEFLYLEGNDYPTEEAQFAVYKSVVQKMNGKKVIIRTLDIGADKQAPYFNLPKEENPAIGYRAIRICLDRKDIFKTQLRAIYRASAFGKVSIMFPMIISVDEVSQIKEIIKEVKKELITESIKYSDNVEIGIMIETPASVMISDDLAKEVDFFSVGTNDLIQYTLAIDRQNNKLNSICEPHHKAVLRMIRMATENAHKYGAWIGICGEMAADEELVETFLSMNVDELSVSPACVLKLRKKIINCDVSKVRNRLMESIGY